MHAYGGYTYHRNINLRRFNMAKKEKKVEVKQDKNYKRTVRSEEEKKVLIARLHRLEGQIKGIIKMVEEDRYCDDVLIQLSSMDKSIKGLANLLIEKHLQGCVSSELKNGNEEIIEEVITFFKRFQ